LQYVAVRYVAMRYDMGYGTHTHTHTASRVLYLTHCVENHVVTHHYNNNKYKWTWSKLVLNRK